MLVRLVGDKLPSNHSVNTDHAVSAPGADVSIVRPAFADSGRIEVLDGIQYSYTHTSGPNTFGSIKGGITIWKGADICWDADVPDYTGSLNLYITCPNDKDLKVTLKGGGSGIIGKLNIQSHLEPA